MEGWKSLLAPMIAGVTVGAIMLVFDGFASHVTQVELDAVESRVETSARENRSRIDEHTTTANIEWRRQAAFRGAVVTKLDLNVSAVETPVADLPVAAVIVISREVIPQ